mmetsp:Transcript_25317/g.86699  ORF Transcript_25317/g.86699 Transcript_25317/m.86699 type:complete len:225 (+) Transcript_25317:820-1494(+)
MASATSTATFFSMSVVRSFSMAGSTSSRVSVCVPETFATSDPNALRPNQPAGFSSAPSSSLSSTSSSASSQAAVSSRPGRYVPRISSSRFASPAARASASPALPLKSSASASLALRRLFRWEPSRQTVGFLGPRGSAGAAAAFADPRRRPPEFVADARRLSFARPDASVAGAPDAGGSSSSSSSSSAAFAACCSSRRARASSALAAAFFRLSRSFASISRASAS